MKVKDFMITDVISVTEKTTVKELLELLVAKKIGGVPVISDANKLRGMISDGDVIRYLKPRGRTIYDMYALVLVSEKEDLTAKFANTLSHPVSKMMRKKELYTLKPEDDLETALNIFSRHHFKKIPVIDKDGNVIGVISRGDIIRYMSNQLIGKN